MQYIVLDLEWNTAYSKKKGKFINEIIEIGAVKLDESFKGLDTISIIVKAQIDKKLRGRVKELTHITNEEVSHGTVFPKAIKEFSKWLGDEENTFLSWGDGDIRVLIKNYEYFTGETRVPFVDNYADVQKFCQSFTGSPSGQQVGLSAMCEMLKVNPDDYSHHRALDDCLMTVACVRKVFDKEKLTLMTKKCDEEFYARLSFKPYVIKDINNPLVDKSKFNCVCDVCGGQVIKKKKWRFSNQSFRADFYCPKCKRNFRLSIRYKQYYDRLDVKRSISEITEKEPKTPVEQKNA